MKKKSIGVTIAGWILIVLGMMGFQHNIFENIIFFRNTTAYTGLLETYSYGFQSLRTSGVPIYDISQSLHYMVIQVLNDNPRLIIVYFVITPFLWFLLFLAGIGILHLRDDWRKTAMFAYPVSVFLKIIIEVYISVYMTVIIVTGKITAIKNRDVFLDVMKTAKASSEVLVKELILSIIPACLLIFFLTRTKVREQFRQKE